MRDCGSTATRQNGTVWKYVPLSPAGWSPRRRNSDAMYSAALKSPSLPVSRPIRESWAIAVRRRSRSLVEIAATVPDWREGRRGEQGNQRDGSGERAHHGSEGVVEKIRYRSPYGAYAIRKD